MSRSSKYDAVIVGSGPNGLSAAILFAKQGMQVLLIEGRDRIGGGSRSAELTLPGYLHDVCSAIHPLAASSRFFGSLPLEKYGLEWNFPPVSAAHPLSQEETVLVYRSLDETLVSLGIDGSAYKRLLQPLLRQWPKLITDLLGPLRIPSHPFSLAQFGIPALFSAAGLARFQFKDKAARALFAGMAAHAMLPLESFASASFGLVLSLSAHAVGWPLPLGGSQKIVDALGAHFEVLGGEIQTGWKVESLDELPPAEVIMLDVTPRQLLSMAGDSLPAIYKRQLNKYRYGAGVYKIDWALDGPIPWRDERICQTATVHLGGTLDEIANSERTVARGKICEKPYVILAQPSLFDASRAPDGKHTAWAYCHVPASSDFPMRRQIEAQVERFAPGFRDQILEAHTINAQEMEIYNPNYIGGDINAGAQDIGQFFTRPVPRWDPYAVPLKGVYLCSASTPPGGGVHGMCGYYAARSALKKEFGLNID